MASRGQQRPLPGPARFVVILAGGESTRLWPLSRRCRPKPFLPLLADGRSLLQDTVDRLVPLVGAERILVVGHRRHRRLLHEQLPALPTEHILLEPEARNTATCLRFTAGWLARRHPTATMICLPADHFVRNAAGLRRALRAAIQLAERQHCLVTIGIPPRGPDTGYGYIAAGGEIVGSGDGRWVSGFVEKPARGRAQRLIGAGALWNAGMFVWRIEDLQAALAQCAPEYNRAFDEAFATGDPSLTRLRAIYAELSPRSIDVALLQPLSSRRQPVRRLAMVPGHFDWEDVGSWNRVPVLWSSDSRGNAAVGEAMCVDSDDCVIHSDGRPTVVLGARGLVVVHRGDVVLVTTRERAEEVRRLPDSLCRRGWESLL